MHREGPGSPRPHPDSPHRHPPYYYFLPNKQPRRREQAILALPLHLPRSLSFNIPTSGLLSARHDQTTPPTRFCGTSTLVFSTTAESFFVAVVVAREGSARCVFASPRVSALQNGPLLRCYIQTGNTAVTPSHSNYRTTGGNSQDESTKLN